MNFAKTVVTIHLLIIGNLYCTKASFAKDWSLLNENIIDIEKGNPLKTKFPHGPPLSRKSEGVILDEEVICPKEGAALFPDPENCNQFWQCANGYKYHMKCPSQLWFNSDENMCDYIYNHPLAQGCADKMCPVGSKDLLPLYEDCTKYIECEDGYAHVLSCCPHKPTTDCSVCYFDDEHKQCVSYYGSSTEK